MAAAKTGRKSSRGNGATTRRTVKAPSVRSKIGRVRIRRAVEKVSSAKR